MLEHGEGRVEVEGRVGVEEVPLPSLGGLNRRDPELELDVFDGVVGVAPTRAALEAHRRRGGSVDLPLDEREELDQMFEELGEEYLSQETLNALEALSD
jgi:hypothetical protein